MSLNVKKWIYGLFSAVIGSGAGSIAVMIVDPKDFNMIDGWKNLATIAGVSALIALAGYLKQHPLPEWNGVERRAL